MPQDQLLAWIIGPMLAVSTLLDCGDAVVLWSSFENLILTLFYFGNLFKLLSLASSNNSDPIMIITSVLSAYELLGTSEQALLWSPFGRWEDWRLRSLRTCLSWQRPDRGVSTLKSVCTFNHSIPLLQITNLVFSWFWGLCRTLCEREPTPSCPYVQKPLPGQQPHHQHLSLTGLSQPSHLSEGKFACGCCRKSKWRQMHARHNAGWGPSSLRPSSHVLYYAFIPLS